MWVVPMKYLSDLYCHCQTGYFAVAIDTFFELLLPPGAAKQVSDWHLIGSNQGQQKLKTSVNSNSKITCLAMAENIWQIFHGRNPHTQHFCSSQKCMFLTNRAPFERELNRLSNGIRFIAKKHCYHREIIQQTQISLLSVLNLYNLSINRYHWWTSSKMAGILKICLI